MKKILLILIASLLFSAVACNEIQTEDTSPSGVLKSFIEAKKKGDVEAIKKTISSDSLKLYEDMARQQETTVEALLTDNTGGILREIPPMRNEKIKGDVATVEAQVPQTGVWQEIPFVKEETGWKLALDKVVMEAMKKIQETLRKQIDEPSEPLPENDKDSNRSESKTNSNN
jgi:hypothetical protein